MGSISGMIMAIPLFIFIVSLGFIINRLGASHDAKQGYALFVDKKNHNHFHAGTITTVIVLFLLATLVIARYIQTKPYTKAIQMIAAAKEKAGAYNACEVKINISTVDDTLSTDLTLKAVDSAMQGYHTDNVYEEYWEKNLEDNSFDIYMGTTDSKTFSHTTDTLSPDSFNPWLINDIWEGVPFIYEYTGVDGVWDTGILCSILESKNNILSGRTFSRYLYISKDSGELIGSIIRVEKNNLEKDVSPTRIYIHGINTSSSDTIVYRQTFQWKNEENYITMPNDFIEVS